MVAAAIVPLAAVYVGEAMIDHPTHPPFYTVALFLAGTALSVGLAWWVGMRGILEPLARLRGMIASDERRQSGGADLINEIALAVQELTSEIGLRRDEAAAAASARLAAEEALHHSIDVLRSTVSTLPVGVVAFGRDGRVKLWNHAAEAILGYTAAEIIDRNAPAAIFSSPAAGGGAAADVFLRIVTGQPVKGEEVQCTRKDGTIVEASFSGAPMMDEHGRLRGAICVFEDIGQRKAIATQLQQAQKMEAVGQLTGGLAHDFNNILGVAIGNLDLLAADLKDRPQAAELAETALNALLRGAELTRALLAFSRRQPLQPALVNVAELLTVVARMLSRTLGEQIRVSLRAEGDLWPVLADAAQLEAAITNLAINARDAMPNGGWLSISARNTTLDQAYVSEATDVQPGDYLLIEISDTGTGMAPDVLARVFEPFFTTKAVGRGTGLGLSMVYGFIKQSGGHIKVYSELGHGTAVRLYLPRAGEKLVAESEAQREKNVPKGTETVLLVEDNADVRRMVENQLTSLGYKVIAAEHGPAALSVLETGTPIDLLFTDVVMPEGMTGFELAEVARSHRPGLRVLITSGFPGTTFHVPAGMEGAADFLSKPYRRQELAHAVRDVLDGKGNGK
ncbi:MAG: response regulator [Magnetospirillum sp.]|nr:response regulator [Magnetospirillum sp.]